MFTPQELSTSPASIQRAALKTCTPAQLDKLRTETDIAICDAAGTENWDLADALEFTEQYIREAQSLPTLLHRM